MDENNVNNKNITHLSLEKLAFRKSKLILNKFQNEKSIIVKNNRKN